MLVLAMVALALVPADAQLLTARAIALLALDRPTEALDDLDHAVAADGSNAESWVLRASALRRLDRVGPAAESVAQALRLEPDNVEALLERGVIRQIQGDGSGARYPGLRRGTSARAPPSRPAPRSRSWRSRPCRRSPARAA